MANVTGPPRSVFRKSILHKNHYGNSNHEGCRCQEIFPKAGRAFSSFFNQHQSPFVVSSDFIESRDIVGPVEP